MINIIVCDDNGEYIKIITKRINQYFDNLKVEYKIYPFTTALDISPRLIGSSDIMFLDVEMDTKSGLELAKTAKRYNEKLIIVFISSFIEYATFGYNVRAFRYILKKDLDVFFNECLDSIMYELKLKKESLAFKVNGEITKIELEKIIYLTKYQKKIIVKTENDNDGKYEFYSSLSSYENELLDKGFVRLQRSFLANMRHIKKIIRGIAYFDNGEEVAVSRENYSDILDDYIAFRSQ